MRDDKQWRRIAELFGMGGELASTPLRVALAHRGAPYPVGAALRALVALLRDRKTNGMRVSVQIVGRARAMSLSRKTAEKDKTVSINQNSQRKGLESAKGNSISSQRNLFASIQSEMLFMQHVLRLQHDADDDSSVIMGSG